MHALFECREKKEKEKSCKGLTKAPTKLINVLLIQITKKQNKLIKNIFDAIFLQIFFLTNNT